MSVSPQDRETESSALPAQVTGQRESDEPHPGDMADADAARELAQIQLRRRTLTTLLDGLFFLVGTVSAGWLAYLFFSESFSRGFQLLWFLLIFWLLLAYLLLPRVHSILTLLYVPDYFIGRTRTHEGLLGDPVNLALFGSEAQIHTAMTAAGWHKADPIGFRSSWRMITSTVLRRSYSDAPVSPLYLFGNIQEFTYQQEVEGNPAKRHHVRFWKTPDGWLLPGGQPAEWLAAGTYDRSVGLSFFTLQVTHRIDKHIDQERDHIVSTLVEANPDVAVDMIKNFSTGYHSVNGGGDAILTDGDLPIIDLTKVEVSPEGARLAADVDDEPLPGDATIRHSIPLTSEANSYLSNRVKRPVSIYLAFLLMLGRALSGVPTLILIGLEWSELVAAITVNVDGAPSQQAAGGLLVLFVAFVALTIASYIVLSILVFRGHNWARFAGMALSLTGVIIVAVDYFNTRISITLETSLVSLSLDILILLALSGTDAAKFSRQRKDSKLLRSARERMLRTLTGG